MDLENLRYPVGRYKSNPNPDKATLESWIVEIEDFPAKVRSAVTGRSIEEINWPYRPDGWKVKQVVHHCADSHMNACIRFKLALTEENPAIKPYEEARWAELADSVEDEMSDSLTLLDVMHKKWVRLLKSLSKEQFQRTYFHPDIQDKVTLADAVGTYAWHCRHHLAHIHQALDSKGEFL